MSNSKENKKEIIGFSPHAGQKKIIDEMLVKFEEAYFLGKNKSHFVLNLGRSWGKTTSVVQLGCYICINYDNNNILYISPTFKLAKKVFRDFMVSVEGAEFIKNINKTDLIITFFNNNQIKFGSSENPTAHRGDNSNSVLILDETAFIQEEMWYDVMQPAMNTRGKLCIFISTPCGKNWFWDLYLKAKSGEKGWYFYEGKSEESPFVNQDEIEEVKKHNPIQYRVEYCAEFLDDNYSVFQNVDSSMIDMPFFGYNTNTEPIYIGIDLGKKHDKSCCVAINSNYEVRDVLQIQNSDDWDNIIPQIANFYRKWNPVHGFIEINFNDRIYDELLREYSCKNLEKIFVEHVKKTQMIQNLQILFTNVANQDKTKKRIAIPSKSQNHDGANALYQELKTYQGKYNSSTQRTKWGAPKGLHDDCVSALLQACWSVTNNLPKANQNSIFWEPI